MAVIAYFLKKGHSLDELLGLSTKERWIYTAVYLDYLDHLKEISEGMEKEVGNG